MAKAAFKRKKKFHQQTGLNFGKTPIKHYIWSTGLYGNGTWTADQKYIESSKM